MQAGLGGGTGDKELMDSEAGLEQRAGATFGNIFASSIFMRQMTIGGLET